MTLHHPAVVPQNAAAGDTVSPGQMVSLLIKFGLSWGSSTLKTKSWRRLTELLTEMFVAIVAPARSKRPSGIFFS